MDGPVISNSLAPPTKQIAMRGGGGDESVDEFFIFCFGGGDESADEFFIFCFAIAESVRCGESMGKSKPLNCPNKKMSARSRAAMAKHGRPRPNHDQRLRAETGEDEDGRGRGGEGDDASRFNEEYEA